MGVYPCAACGGYYHIQCGCDRMTHDPLTVAKARCVVEFGVLPEFVSVGVARRMEISDYTASSYLLVGLTSVTDAHRVMAGEITLATGVAVQVRRTGRARAPQGDST